jgi:Domain of unknown function (DUF4129)
MTVPVPIGGDAARAAAQQELQRGEYHRDDPGWFSRALRWIGDRLDSIVSGTPTGSATLILVVLLVAIAVFVIIRAGRPGRRVRAGASDDDPLAPDGRLDHRRLADAHERAGRYADALREWLRAIVETIEARGILEARPGRTGVGVAREGGAALPAIAGDLDAVVDTFNEVWFGQRAASAADAANAHRVADAVRTARIAMPAADSRYAVPQ